jgi:hypothetical protein
MTPSYRELPPSRALARHVACLWYQRVGETAVVHHVVPDACSDIVVIDGGAPMAVGPASSTVLVELPAHGVVVGARFRPGMTPVGFGVPARELLDTDVPLDAVWKPRLASELEQRLCDARSIPDKLGALESFLLERVPEQRPVDTFVESAVRAIAASPGRAVHDIVPVVPGALGERQVLRRFREAVGYGPKTLQRVLRLQRLLVLSAETRANLGSLALAAGYADQPHMTREVRELAGETPLSLLRRQWAPSAMSDFFKTVTGAHA